MKIIILLNILIIALTLKEVDKKFEKLVGKNMMQYQVGVLNKIPDGPLTDEKLKEASDDQIRKNSNEGYKGKIGMVYISDALKNKRLGKFRIKSQGLDLVFPTDISQVKYQDIRDNDYFKQFAEKNRIAFEKKKLIESEKDKKINPFKDIYDMEKTLIDTDILEMKNPKNYEKNLMSLANEKENEIYNKMYRNEWSEVKEKRYNKAVYNPIYKNDLYIQKS
jgi:hypothetical protein